MYRLTLLLALALFACTDKTDDTDAETPSDTGDTGIPGDVEQDDQDGDTILDVHEGHDDPDGDNTPNFLDKDSDGDTIKDKVEAGDDELMTLPLDSDGDGTPDYLDLDSDNNCVPDQAEKGGDQAVDTDGDGLRDFADADNDGDGILDVDEIGDIYTCTPSDTDGDGVPDYMDLDSDGDGIGDAFEWGGSSFDPDPTDTDEDGIPDFQDLDSDNDGIADEDESFVTSYLDEPADSDGDGLYDFQDTDSDGDGLTDADELNKYGTDPRDFDSDGDGFSDGGEVLAGTDPLDPESVIDGIYIEVGERTETEADFDFELRIERGDLAFLTDTTGSMSGTITAVQSSYSTIMSDAEDTFEDVAGGGAEFDDYAYGSMGSTPDLPFRLTVGVTTDTSAVTSAVSSWFASGGSDGPEGTIEALYQAASGAGYDQGCDGSYDTNTDVPPYIATSSDPFKGKGGENYDSSLTDTGLRGGMGFREYSLPIIIYATDNLLRDPDNTSFPSAPTTTPGGCPMDAGHLDVISALEDINGYIIGLNVTGSEASYGPWPQMIDLAQKTNSYADIDGDGDADDELVYTLNQNSPTFASDFSDFVITAVDQLVQSITFSDVELQVDGDEYGFVTAITPEAYTDIDPNTATELDFTLTFRGVVAATTEDQLFLLTLNVLGDGSTLLDSKDIVILVPGTSY